MKEDFLPKFNKEEYGPKQKKVIVEIPVEGALGLLALGADGIRAWKDIKKQHGKILNGS